MQIIYFVIKTHIFFIIFTIFCKNIERVKMTTIFKYFMFRKYSCLDTNARGCCMYVFLVDEIITCKKPNNNSKLLDLVNRQTHRHSHACRKKSKNICRFNYPQPPIDKLVTYVYLNTYISELSNYIFEKEAKRT